MEYFLIEYEKLIKGILNGLQAMLDTGLKLTDQFLGHVLTRFIIICCFYLESILLAIYFKEQLKVII